MSDNENITDSDNSSMPMIKSLKRKRIRETISSDESDHAEGSDMNSSRVSDVSRTHTPIRSNTPTSRSNTPTMSSAAPIGETPTQGCSNSYLTLNSRQLLQSMFERQEEILQRLKRVENSVEGLKNIGKKTEISEKINVPSSLRNAVRNGYKDGEERGLKWNFEGKRVVDRENKEMNDHITTYVKGRNPGYTDNDVINCAITRYFTTKKQEEVAKKKNKLEAEKKRRVIYERKKEKSKRRLAALEKIVLNEPKKTKIKKVLKPMLMSSDEECQEGFLTHQPSWQSAKFKKYKSILDAKYNEICSSKSKRLLQKRTIGAEHNKDPPQLSEDMSWVMKDSSSTQQESTEESASNI